MKRYAYIFRYVYGVLAAAAIVAIVSLISLYLIQDADRKARDRITFYHAKSATVSERLRRQNHTIPMLLGYETREAAGQAAATFAIVSAGPDIRGTLKMMSDEIAELRALQVQYDDPQFSATLDRVTQRFDDVQDSISRDVDRDAVIRVLSTFDLAIEQLYRQHSIAAEHALAEINLAARQIAPILAIIASILAVTGLIGWYATRLLRGAILRREDAVQALAASEERAQHLQKLDALGKLVGGVAHDFNNLLTAIIGQTSLLLERSAGDERMRSGLRQVKQAGLQAAGLTRQLLTFSRPQPIERRVINMNELIGHVEELLKRIIGEDVRLSVRCADDLYSVEVDPGQMEQVIVNLAVNARDAMPNGGQLAILTENVSISLPQPASDATLGAGHYVKLVVADTGTGMDKETCKRIFEPYFSTKPIGRGTGLGLSTVHGIITGSKGQIRVTSSVGAGTRFEIFLPKSEATAEELWGEKISADDVAGTETILIVEDEAHIRRFLDEGLGSLGYRVLIAPNAEAGLDFCTGEFGQIDIIVSDVIMPQTNGAEFLERARKLQPLAKAILMSGYTEDALSDAGIDESRIPLIHKPFDIAALASMIRRSVEVGTLH